MKKFNLKREQRKLWIRQHKSSIIKYGTCIISTIILVVAVLYFSKADFSTTVTFDVIDAHVTPFINDNVKFAYNIDGVDSDTIMANDGTKYNLTNYTCDNSEVITWNNNTWSVDISNMSGKVKCKLYFETLPEPSEPELYDALIPVKYSVSGNTVTYTVADTTNTNNDWYNYDEHKWANAVLVSSSNLSKYQTAGTTINSSDILQMYVWIPRYRYKLFSNATDAENLINSGNTDEQMIEIEWENCKAVNGVCSNANYNKSNGLGQNGRPTKGEWYSHPAFTFGYHELNGFWVGKFEPAYNGTGKGQANGTDYSGSLNGLFTCSNETCSSASNIRILPNLNPIRYHNISNKYYISRSIANVGGVGLSTTKTDSHMMKNMEWGAVAYLTNSKYGRYIDSSTCTSGGCEVWPNPYKDANSTLKTGCAGTAANSYYIATCNAWYTTNGVHASTTDNIYGIYDMSGGCYEDVMGNINSSYPTSTYTFYPVNSGFSNEPESKYYDLYLLIRNTFDRDEYAKELWENGKLGDATKETIKDYSHNPSGWYGKHALFNNGFFYRGGCYNGDGGLFYINTGGGGGQNSVTSFRIVLTAP